ncbi:hypothetical protein ROZALSC1DRAFT_24775 [Rozella allomycis CSF55]|uniref:PiggyBac transposable element-derived protein domain-containing protein n=1 Tax=Rozella allomycis (strain CSF55) TaxID=988480 RepID=A0A4P9YCJ1_ROZAC|nr:hypothetical protein ROZALSC1DRAFT_24775 [Rozella allomycis CSF55]
MAPPKKKRAPRPAVPNAEVWHAGTNNNNDIDSHSESETNDDSDTPEERLPILTNREITTASWKATKFQKQVIAFVKLLNVKLFIGITMEKLTMGTKYKETFMQFISHSTSCAVYFRSTDQKEPVNCD